MNSFYTKDWDSIKPQVYANATGLKSTAAAPIVAGKIIIDETAKKVQAVRSVATDGTLTLVDLGTWS